MFVEMGVGVYVNSLGLISDAFHMLSDCLSIFVALVAAYISTGQADRVNTYGYKRVEILTGLFNAVFLVFVAFNVFWESIERILEPQYVEPELLLTVSVLGLAVNVIGLVFFQEHAHQLSHQAHHECPFEKHAKLPASKARSQDSPNDDDEETGAGSRKDLSTASADYAAASLDDSKTKNRVNRTIFKQYF